MYNLRSKGSPLPYCNEELIAHNKRKRRIQTSESNSICSVCYSNGGNNENEEFDEMKECFICNIRVHSKCYGCSSNKKALSIDSNNRVWKCRLCVDPSNFVASNSNNNPNNPIIPKCALCQKTKFGAFKPCDHDRKELVHLVCALWTPMVCVKSEYHRSPVQRVDVLKEQYTPFLMKIKCEICNDPHATVKCRVKSCDRMFHPLCLIEKHPKCMKSQKTQNINKLTSTTFYAYCPDHVALHRNVDLVPMQRQPHSRKVEFMNGDMNKKRQKREFDDEWRCQKKAKIDQNPNSKNKNENARENSASVSRCCEQDLLYKNSISPYPFPLMPLCSPFGVRNRLQMSSDVNGFIIDASVDGLFVDNRGFGGATTIFNNNCQESQNLNFEFNV